MSTHAAPETLVRIAGLSTLPGAPQESVLTKSLPKAFAGIELAQRIRATGRRQIIIAGFATHMCVSAWRAPRTRDLPNPLGEGVTTAAAIQQGTLAALSDRFSVVIQDTAVLEERARHAAKVE